MKRKLFVLLITVLMLGALFFIGPAVGQAVLRKITPGERISAWKSEARKLDAAQTRTPETEARRLEVLRKLAQRGIYIDGGLRDEAIEHNPNPFTFAIMATWRWRELFGK
jgi:hypothetical protein